MYTSRLKCIARQHEAAFIEIVQVGILTFDLIYSLTYSVLYGLLLTSFIGIHSGISFPKILCAKLM